MCSANLYRMLRRPENVDSAPWQVQLLGFAIAILATITTVKSQQCSVFNGGKLQVSVNPLILYGKGINKQDVYIKFGTDWSQKKPLKLQVKSEESWTKNVIFASFAQHSEGKFVCNVSVNDASPFRVGTVPSQELSLTFSNSSEVTWSLCGSDESSRSNSRFGFRYDTGSPQQTGSTQLDSGTTLIPHHVAVIPTAWPTAYLPKDHVTWILVSVIAVLIVIISVLSVILHIKRKR